MRQSEDPAVDETRAPEPSARAAQPALLLASSGPHAHVAFWAEGTLREAPPLPTRGRGRLLLPTVDALVREAGHTPAALAWIGVDIGPGSFTGVRLGVTVAKTLAYALDVPVFAATSLSLLAHAADAKGPVLALRAAGRGTWYGAAFAGRAATATQERAHRAPCGEPSRRTWADWQPEATATIVLDAGAERPPGLAPGATAEVQLTARVLFDWVQKQPGDAAVASAHTLAPCYLQPSAPERLRRGEA